MQNLDEGEIRKYRDPDWEKRLLDNGWKPFDPKGNGCFWIPHRRLGCIVSSGGGWDHISVQKTPPPILPDWNDLDYVARLFFKPDETAMQLHVPREDHVNNHPRVLHLWRPHGIPIPRPPKDYV